MRHRWDVAVQRAKHVAYVRTHRVSFLVLHESYVTGSIGQVLKIDLKEPIMDVSPLFRGIFRGEINDAVDGIAC